MGDKHFSLQFILEYAVAVCIVAVSQTERNHATTINLYALYLIYIILYLCTVCANVLNSRSTRITRNERQVFESVPSLLHTVCHQVVPAFAAAHPHHHIIAYDVRLNAHHRGVHHSAIIVAHKQQIASSTYYYIWLLANHAPRLYGIFGAVIVDISAACGANAKGIMTGQVIIIIYCHCLMVKIDLSVNHFLKQPFIIFAHKGEFNLKTVCYASKHKDLMVALSVFLPIDNIIYHVRR